MPDDASISSGVRSPLVAELSKFRDERKLLTFALLGGETREGVVRWFDDAALHIVTPDREELTLFRHAILYYRVS